MSRSGRKAAEPAHAIVVMCFVMWLSVAVLCLFLVCLHNNAFPGAMGDAQLQNQAHCRVSPAPLHPLPQADIKPETE